MIAFTSISNPHGYKKWPGVIRRVFAIGKISSRFFIALIVLCAGHIALAQQPLPEFSSRDRILILAPHPDDETIATAGVIQRALAAGSRIKVICFTNGDNNELSFIVYEKRLTFRKGIFLHMGMVRATETMQAMGLLGLERNDVNFMGYPDFGTMEILMKYWNTSVPYQSMFPRVRKVSYSNALSAGAPFVGESILADFKTILMAFRPTKIFVSHPADTNRDHQSLYLFLSVALWDLEGKITRPEVFPYLIHVIGWPQPRGRHQGLSLKPPKDLIALPWQQLALTEKEIANKEHAIGMFKSQIAYDPPYLYTFARTNELFGNFKQIALESSPDENSIKWHSVSIADEPKPNGSFLYYAIVDKTLRIKIALRRKIDKNIGLYINLLGYSKKRTLPTCQNSPLPSAGGA